MEWWEILILIIAIICIVYAVYLFLKVKLNHKKTFIKRISKIINTDREQYDIKASPSNSIHHFEIKSDKEYLIKLIHMNPKHEIIITNSKNVAVNGDIKDWKRSTKPHFISKMKAFINLDVKADQVKVALIYPDCYNITKYINESDVFLVEKFQKIDSVYYVKMKDLLEFIKKD